MLIEILHDYNNEWRQLAFINLKELAKTDKKSEIIEKLETAIIESYEEGGIDLKDINMRLLAVIDLKKAQTIILDNLYSDKLQAWNWAIHDFKPYQPSIFNSAPEVQQELAEWGLRQLDSMQGSSLFYQTEFADELLNIYYLLADALNLPFEIIPIPKEQEKYHLKTYMLIKHMNRPFQTFDNLLLSQGRKSIKVIELCAGNGEFALFCKQELEDRFSKVDFAAVDNADFDTKEDLKGIDGGIVLQVPTAGDLKNVSNNSTDLVFINNPPLTKRDEPILAPLIEETKRILRAERGQLVLAPYSDLEAYYDKLSTGAYSPEVAARILLDNGFDLIQGIMPSWYKQKVFYSDYKNPPLIIAIPQFDATQGSLFGSCFVAPNKIIPEIKSIVEKRLQEPESFGRKNNISPFHKANKLGSYI